MTLTREQFEALLRPAIIYYTRDLGAVSGPASTHEPELCQFFHDCEVQWQGGRP